MNECRNCGSEIDHRDHGLCEICRRDMLRDYFEGDGDDIPTPEDYGNAGFDVLDEFEVPPQ